MATNMQNTPSRGPWMAPLSKEERQRLALASLCSTMTTAEDDADLANLRQRAAIEEEQHRTAQQYQDYMNNRWQLTHYPTMPVPEEWKPFITASTAKQDEQAQGRVASAGTESIMLSSNRQPNVSNPLTAETPPAAPAPMRNDRASAREKAAQIQAERRAKEEAEEAARRAERVKKGNPTLSDLLFHTNYSTSNGLETLPETAKRYYDEGERWVKDNPVDSAALALSPIPIVGDAAGLAADIHHYYQNPDDLTWKNLGLSGLGLLPWVPHGAVMVKSVKGLHHDLDLLAKGGQEAVIVGKLSDEQVRQILKIVPPEAGEAFLLTDKMLRATPNLVEHLTIRRSEEMEYLLQQLPNFPSKAAVYPNIDPSRQHKPTFLLYNEEIDEHIIFVIDTIAKKGELVPITTHIAKERDIRKLEKALQNMNQYSTSQPLVNYRRRHYDYNRSAYLFSYKTKIERKKHAQYCKKI